MSRIYILTSFAMSRLKVGKFDFLIIAGKARQKKHSLTSSLKFYSTECAQNLTF